jgi:hypothetical protein
MQCSEQVPDFQSLKQASEVQMVFATQYDGNEFNLFAAAHFQHY